MSDFLWWLRIRLHVECINWPFMVSIDGENATYQHVRKCFIERYTINSSRSNVPRIRWQLGCFCTGGYKLAVEIHPAKGFPQFAMRQGWWKIHAGFGFFVIRMPFLSVMCPRKWRDTVLGLMAVPYSYRRWNSRRQCCSCFLAELLARSRSTMYAQTKDKTSGKCVDEILGCLCSIV